MDYYNPGPAGAPIRWVTIGKLDSVAQWHKARAALDRSQIQALMGEGNGVAAGDGGIEIKVPEPDAERATIILQNCLADRRWCPRCGSADLQTLPVPWYWTLWSILFLGVAPFSPPRWACRNCGKRMD